MCLNHVGGWFSKTQRDKKFDPGYWIKFLEPPWLARLSACKEPILLPSLQGLTEIPQIHMTFVPLLTHLLLLSIPQPLKCFPTS